tara:strand:- start:13390 stop:13962 length:573 start_codon:yes stop_codon:yes gene_type:complete
MRKILIIGVGGIGSFLTQFLNRLNIYDITVADSDSVDKKNLLYQNYQPSSIGYNKAKEIRAAYHNVRPIAYDILVDKQLMGYDLVICCADNLDVRRLVYRQGHGSRTKVKWLDLRAQGRNGVLISHLIDPALSDTFLDGPEGSFSCQADNWNGKAKNIDMMNIVMASMGAQWIQKWFNKEEVNPYMVMNI